MVNIFNLLSFSCFNCGSHFYSDQSGISTDNVITYLCCPHCKSLKLLVQADNISLKTSKKQFYYRNDVKDKNPDESGWYDTSKGSLFWMYDKQQWSRKDDILRREYPNFWYEIQEVPIPDHVNNFVNCTDHIHGDCIQYDGLNVNDSFLTISVNIPNLEISQNLKFCNVYEMIRYSRLSLANKIRNLLPCGDSLKDATTILVAENESVKLYRSINSELYYFSLLNNIIDD